MTDLPKLTESHVRRWTGAGVFERGERYFRRGHILDPQRQGGQEGASVALGQRRQIGGTALSQEYQESQEYTVRPCGVCLVTVDS